MDEPNIDLEADIERKRAMMPKVFLASLHLVTLNLEVEEYKPEAVTLRLPFREDLTNDGLTYHGGVIATLIDSAGGLCAWSNYGFDREHKAATLAMSINYIGSVKKEDLYCFANTTRRAKELIFTEMHAKTQTGRTIAQGIQTYRIA